MDIILGMQSVVQMPRYEGLKNQSPGSTASTLSSSQTWNHNHQATAASYQQLRRLSEWGIAPLQDSSPTVVGQERFDSQDILTDTDYRKDFVTISVEESKWGKLVDLVMRQLPYGDSAVFVDEFQYEIISSELLTSSVSASRQLFHIQKSIVDFNKSTATAASKVQQDSIPTKYGYLSYAGKRFHLQRNVPYMFTVLFVRKALRRLLYQRQHDRSAVMSILLISLYLALQQEFFQVKYIKYSALLNLKQMNSTLQMLDKLICRYHLRYKELTVYKPISLVQNHGVGVDDSRSLALISDLLSSTLDQVFYKLKIASAAILLIINVSQLTDYTGIYNVDLQVLYRMTHSSDVLSISEKLERAQLMKKFLLCCLLSINENVSSNGGEVAIILKKIFPNYDPAKTSEAEKFHTISKNLATLTQSFSSMLPVLHHHRYLLILAHQSNIEQTLKSRSKGILIEQSLSRLAELQRYLMKETEVTDENSAFINTGLKELHKLWNNTEASKLRGDNGINVRKVSGRPSGQRFFSGGINLGVVKTDRDMPILYDSFPKLNSAVDVLKVDETGSDIESDQEETIYANENEQQITTDDTKFLRLTDDQLRHELNQRILNLAIENKKSRENLRKQKSFELMNKKIVHDNKGRTLTSNKQSFNSEESIPVLFELKQYLNTN